MSDQADYFLWVNSEAHGPFERSQLVEGLMNGEIPKDTPVATPDSTKWVPISSVIQVAPTADFDAVNFGETRIIPKDPKDK